MTSYSVCLMWIGVNCIDHYRREQPWSCWWGQHRSETSETHTRKAMAKTQQHSSCTANFSYKCVPFSSEIEVSQCVLLWFGCWMIPFQWGWRRKQVTAPPPEHHLLSLHDLNSFRFSLFLRLHYSNGKWR